MFKLFKAITLRRVSQPNIRTREAVRSHRKVLLMGTFSFLIDDGISTAVGRREVSSLTIIFTVGGWAAMLQNTDCVGLETKSFPNWFSKLPVFGI